MAAPLLIDTDILIDYLRGRGTVYTDSRPPSRRAVTELPA